MRGRAWKAGAAGALALSCAVACGPMKQGPRDPTAREPGQASQACDAGLYVVDGACLSPRQVDSFCRSRSLESACLWPTCAPGEALDPRAAACVSQRETRAVVAAERPAPGPSSGSSSLPPTRDASLASCRDDHLLVAHDDHAVCLPKSSACPREAHPNPIDPAHACVTAPPCPLGNVRSGGACFRVASNHTIDVGAWTQAVLGGDGGPGNDRVCATLGIAPWDADVGPGGSRTVPLTIDLTFPNNDPSAAAARVTADLSSSGLLALQAAVNSLLIPLRALARPRATTDAASASVHLMCGVDGGSSPLVTSASDR